MQYQIYASVDEVESACIEYLAARAAARKPLERGVLPRCLVAEQRLIELVTRKHSNDAKQTASNPEPLAHEDWVTCPICGDTGMLREFEDEAQIIHCNNINCASNGGTMSQQQAGAAEVSDEQIVTALESAGVEFQRFMGGLSGAQDIWTTAGSQQVKKIAAGVRAILALKSAGAAASKEQPLAIAPPSTTQPPLPNHFNPLAHEQTK